MRRYLFLLFYFLLIFMISSCNNEGSQVINEELKENKDALYELTDSLIIDKPDISKEIISELMTTIPKPIEILANLKDNGGLYSPELLLNTENIKKYSSAFQMAFVLGVYKADFTYININNDKASVTNYLNKVTDVSGKMDVGSFFDNSVMNRFKTNIENTDSLHFITEQTFEKIFDYFKTKNHTSVNVLISCGSWIESMYLATNTKKIEEKKAVYSRIGEQQVALDNTIFLLSVYSKEPNFKSLLTDLMELSKEFEKVKITYSYAKPTIKEVDGRLEITDNSTSSVELSDELYKSIGLKIKNIRQKLVK